MINGTAHISRILAFKKPEQQFREVTDDIYPGFQMRPWL
jgi:hypothetical protein